MTALDRMIPPYDVPIVLYRRGAATTTTNDTKAVNVVSVVVPAGLLGADRLLEIEAGGTWTNDSGSSRNLEITVGLGSTTLYQDDVQAATDADAHAWHFTGVVAALSTSSQRFSGLCCVSNSVAATTGTGNWGTERGIGSFRGTSSEDTTSDKTLVVQLRMTSAHVSHTFTIDHAKVVLV